MPTTAEATTLQVALRSYLDHLAVERGLAPNTLASYRRDLRRYVQHLAGADVRAPEQVGEAHVASFLVALREGDDEHPPLAANSAARAVVAVRGLHRFLLREGLATADPARSVRPPAPPKRLPKAISVEAVEALLEAAGAEQTPRALRDRAIDGRTHQRGAGASPARRERLEIHSIAAGGEGVGRLADGRAIFVHRTALGEAVEVVPIRP